MKSFWLKVAAMRPYSLKAKLLLWLIPGLLLTMVGSLWFSSHYLRNQVDVAHDRSLAGALHAIDHNTSTMSGGLAVEQPFLLLEFFEMSVNGRVYFRVATEDGLAEVGSPELPLPKGGLRDGKLQFYDALYQGEPVRVAALIREANPPILGRPELRIIVQVAEGLKTRDAFQGSILRTSVERDAIGVLISVLLLIIGVFMALKPLARLREDMDLRNADDLSPIDAVGLPSEVRPVVAAVNRHIVRYAHMAEAQRQFLDDASHQLRTPLSVLRTQISYALRESDPDELHTVLFAMQEGLARAERLTNQMLTLARARNAPLIEGGLVFEPVDLCALAESVSRAMLPIARAKRIDFGLEFSALPLEAVTRVYGVEWLLREALTNLIDNAIRYSPIEGQVTIEVRHDGATFVLQVEDSGPGMSDEDRVRAGVRFRRGSAGKPLPGAGLGLAIVRTIAQLHRANLVLGNRVEAHGQRSGFCAALVFTLDLNTYSCSAALNTMN